MENHRQSQIACMTHQHGIQHTAEMETDQTFPDRLKRALDADLKVGEKVLWAQSPIPIGPGQWLKYLLVLLLIVVISQLVFHHLSRTYPLWGNPFLWMWLLLLPTPLLNRMTKATTLYVITNRRAIILRGTRFGSSSVQSYQPEQLQKLSLYERDDGTGDLVFDRISMSDGTTHNIGFMRVSDVHQVDGLIREALKGQHG